MSGDQLPTPPPLAVGQCHLWTCLVSAEPEARLVQACAAMLDGSERERMNRFRFPPLRAAFALHHAFLRTVLARYLEIPPEDLQFQVAPLGKPQLITTASARAGDLPSAAPAAPWEFSLTHTKGLVAVAVAKGVAVGVDAERMTAEPERSIARQCFASEETALLAAAGEADWVALFYRLWTLKEAYLKARGTGLATPLHTFAVGWRRPDSAAGGEPYLHRPPVEHPEHGRWPLACPPAAVAGYSLALALAGAFPTATPAWTHHTACPLLGKTRPC